jgi:hypothetical protein
VLRSTFSVILIIVNVQSLLRREIACKGIEIPDSPCASLRFKLFGKVVLMWSLKGRCYIAI